MAPLLFIQTLYQQLFYTATILVGGLWLSLLAVLATGYSAAYAYKFSGLPGRGVGRGLWIGMSAVAFLGVAGTHVVVHLAHVQPALWAVLDANPWRALIDPTSIPRLLQLVLASVAFAATVMTVWAVRRAGVEGDDLESGVARSAWRWVLWATALQVADGVLLLLVLPAEVQHALVRSGPEVWGPLALGILGGLALVMLIAQTPDPVAASGLVRTVAGVMTGVVALMTVTRDQVRTLCIAGLMDPGAAGVHPQWLNVGLFAVLLVLALAVVTLLTRWVVTAPARDSGAA